MQNQNEPKFHAEVVAESEEFDAEFYSQRYMIGEFSRDRAAYHYSVFGAYDTRAPSPKFDSYDYLNQNIDVASHSSAISPLVHYLMYGKEEGRSYQHQVDRYPFLSNPISLRDIYDESAEKLIGAAKIAVTIHAFYTEHLERYLQQLVHFPYEFDVFVTTPDHNYDVVRHFGDQLKAATRVKSVSIANCQNRGRNFGPLLVEFGKRLLNYDLIGHIHTKKSLYTGKTRLDLARRGASAVLGDPDYLRAIFSGMLKGQIGLVAAEKDPSLPFWAYHWLKNGTSRQYLHKKCRVDFAEDLAGFLDYPVGGMFWATNRVVRPLFEKRWQYSEFPPEDGQIDGTLHHGIERFIGELCRCSGGEFLRWSPDAGVFFAGENAGVAALKRISWSSVRDAMLMSNVVSFDVFDTLVYRIVPDPNDIRDQLGSQLRDYRNIRAESERLAREDTSKGDVGLKDIAASMSRLTGKSIVECLELLHKEFMLDAAAFRPRKTVIEAVRYAKNQGKRVIYVTDMYYGRHDILDILDRVGVPRPDKLYLSSALGKRKDRGDLWEYVLSCEEGSILHLGDNMVSDVQNAADHGIRSVYLPSIWDKCLLLGVTRRRLDSKLAPLLSSAVSFYGENPLFC